MRGGKRFSSSWDWAEGGIGWATLLGLERALPAVADVQRKPVSNSVLLQCWSNAAPLSHSVGLQGVGTVEWSGSFSGSRCGCEAALYEATPLAKQKQGLCRYREANRHRCRQHCIQASCQPPPPLGEDLTLGRWVSPIFLYFWGPTACPTSGRGGGGGGLLGPLGLVVIRP